MNAIQDFFRKHNAVPANDRGRIDWAKASDEALLGWLKEDAKLIQSGSLADRDLAHVKVRFAGIVEVAWDRADRLAQQCPFEPADWQGRTTLGLLLAALMVNCRGLIEVRVK